MVKKTSDGKGADATEVRGDGGKIGTGIKIWRKVALDDAIFAGGASVYKNGARGNDITRYQPRCTRGAYDYIKIFELCQVATAMEEGDIVV